MLTKIQRSKESGYSLVELLVAMVLLSIGFLAMGNLFLASMEHSKQGRHDMIALNSASPTVRTCSQVMPERSRSARAFINGSSSTPSTIRSFDASMGSITCLQAGFA